MRVIYFTHGYGPHDHRFLSALAATRHEVFLLQLKNRDASKYRFDVPPAIRKPAWVGGRRPFRWRDTLLLARDLRRVADAVGADLVHAGPVNTCAFVAVRSGFRPILTMSWGFDLQEDAQRNLWWRAITRYTLKRSTFFTCDARATAALATAYGMSKNRMSLFPWGVDLKHFAPGGAPRVPGRAAQRFVVLCNRSCEPRYGVDCVARAFALAARHVPAMVLVLLGGGSEESKIRKTLTDAGLAERVEFGGYVSQDELPHWYRRADIYVSASHVDGSSVSLMEALACGTPALVSDIPANREWVEEGLNGWLFPDGDAEALADRLVQISNRRAELAGFARRARASAEKKADWQANFPVLLHSYEEAVRLHQEGEA
jgi:glycosyltransferase involved in cell wall biosynthesis